MNIVSQTMQPMIGESPAFLETLEHTSWAAKVNKPVLVIGERGTGKELISSRLHFLSSRWDQRFVRVNCAALTESLLESELFGHEKGAFTGATQQHTGCFERADGGTLVLDELGNISLRMQEKILRVIEYGDFQRVGGTATLRTDARIVAATNIDLVRQVSAGRFRADLLDRLAFDVIHIPPLRVRGDDILLLARHFAVAAVAELKRDFFPGFSAAAETAMLQFGWPGNVRQLRYAVERSIYRSADPEAPVDSLQFDPFQTPIQHHFAALPDAVPALEQSVPASSAAPEPRQWPVDFQQQCADQEIALLEAALVQARFRQGVAADLLGLTYHQLRGLLRKYGLPKTVSAVT